MILSIVGLPLALLGSRGQNPQQNPPGTSVMPTQAAFYSAAGATATVEIRNAFGQVVVLTDQAGNKYSHASVALPAGVAVGLGWKLTQTSSPGSALYVALNTQYTMTVTLSGGSATESPAGTYDSSAGAGNGIATGGLAPDSGSPTLLVAGTTYTIGYGGAVTGYAGTSSLPAGAATSANQQTPVNPLDLGIYNPTSSSVVVNCQYVALSTGLPVQLFDTNNVAQGTSFAVTIPATTADGLSWAIRQLKPDSTHPLVLPSVPVGLRIGWASGGIVGSAGPSLRFDTGGTIDGSAGTAGSGFNTGYTTSASAPWTFYQLSYTTIGGIQQ